MVRRLLVLALLAVATLWARPAWACSCGAPRSFAQRLPEAEVAFAGYLETGPGTLFLRVERVYKGSVPLIVHVKQNRGWGTSCEIGPPHERPVLYAGPRTPVRQACNDSMSGPEPVALPWHAPELGIQHVGPGFLNVLIALLGVAAVPLVRVGRDELAWRRRVSLERRAEALSR